MSFESGEFRQALGCYPTGVAVVTALGPDGARLAMTASSFTSVSLDPPLVSFCLDRASVWFQAFQAAGHFAVNVLREDQAHLSDDFARIEGGCWQGLDTVTWRTGCPILKHALAAFECRVHARHPAGDHVILVGEVLGIASDGGGAPLAFFRGGYRRLAGEG
ncbi:MAG: flavin reductase family protein [Rhodospirillales bacterium]|nr:flavin reductase family protein [Rhodospirillales bacterium]